MKTMTPIRLLRNQELVAQGDNLGFYGCSGLEHFLDQAKER